MATAVAGCASRPTITNDFSGQAFAALQSDFRVTDLNHYGCEPIDASDLKHILETGVAVSARDLHDYYSITGCSISGTVTIDGTPTDSSSTMAEFSTSRMGGCWRAASGAVRKASNIAHGTLKA